MTVLSTADRSLLAGLPGRQRHRFSPVRMTRPEGRRDLPPRALPNRIALHLLGVIADLGARP